MSDVAKKRQVWEKARAIVVASTNPKGLLLPRGRLPHPRDAGARLTMTWPVGQIADYALDGPPGQAPLMIREFPAHWHAFIPGVQSAPEASASVDPKASGAPFVAAAGAAMLGGAIGASLSNKRAGVLVGAGIGILVAAALTAMIDEAEPTKPKRPKLRKGQPK